jgi:multicomponent Na+:H+ antiporter subunit D
MAADWIAPSVPWAALAVAIPLAASLLASLSARIGAALAWPVSLLGLAVALGATAQVATHGPVTLALGGWQAPLGIVLRLDGLACVFLLTGSLVAWAALVYARGDLRPAPGEAGSRKAWAFWPLAYALLAALQAAFVSADLFNLYVALELLTVAAVALVALEGSRAAVSSAIRYMLFALAGSLAYLLGVVLVYGGAGTLDLALLGGLPAHEQPQPLALALMTVGLMAKAALFPLHAWLPGAHASAPAPASALLSALVVKAPFVILLRLWGEAAGEPPPAAIAQGLALLGAAGMVLGSVMAWRQERLKLVIAYSTVAQLGYLMFIFPLAFGPGRSEWGVAAWSGVVFHALAHALAKGAMFLSAGAMAQALGHDRVEGLAGLGRVLPISAFAFGIAAVSLMGLPPSGGFLAKYLLLTAAWAGGQWWWALVMLAGGLMAAAYLFRPLSCLLAKGTPTLVEQVPRGRQALGLVLALAAVALGLLSAGPFRLLQRGHPLAWEPA